MHPVGGVSVLGLPPEAGLVAVLFHRTNGALWQVRSIEPDTDGLDSIRCPVPTAYRRAVSAEVRAAAEAPAFAGVLARPDEYPYDFATQAHQMERSR